MSLKLSHRYYLSILFISFLYLNISLARASGAPYLSIPTTVSESAQEFLRSLSGPDSLGVFPQPEETQKWIALQHAFEMRNLERQKPVIALLKPKVTKREFNKVPVLEVKPKNWKASDKVVVYVHGGGFTFYSARSTLMSSALVAEKTGLRVIAVDYTLAPHAQWEQIIDEVIAVFQGLKDSGYSLQNIAVYGDSAGGALATGTVLKMRDQGLEMPAAVILWSPWSDITSNGDSYTTLKHAEPFYRYDEHLKPMANAYADPKYHKHPYVSPVYADYSKGFPPTLIQGGTKELLLSNFIRHYQALDLAGQSVKLDLYEGMPHVFQAYLPFSPESEMALDKVKQFLIQHLQ